MIPELVDIICLYIRVKPFENGESCFPNCYKLKIHQNLFYKPLFSYIYSPYEIWISTVQEERLVHTFNMNNRKIETVLSALDIFLQKCCPRYIFTKEVFMFINPNIKEKLKKNNVKLLQDKYRTRIPSSLYSPHSIVDEENKERRKGLTYIRRKLKKDKRRQNRMISVLYRFL